VRLYNITTQFDFSPLQFRPADGATVAVISQLSTMSIFTMDTNVFKLHSSRVFLVGVLPLSVITGYLLTSFTHNFWAVKRPLLSLQNII